MHHPQTKSWEEWKRLCALDLCCADTQEDLVRFVAPILTSKIHRLDPAIQLSTGKQTRDSPNDYFHLFESYMHLPSRATGKRWKEWLMQVTARSNDSNEVALERAVCSCLRTISIKFCLDEGNSRAVKADVRVVSSDAPISPDSIDSPLGLFFFDENAPDPSCEAEISELRGIAKKEAAILFPKIEAPLRIAILSLALGRKLTDSAFTQVADRSSSTLYAELKKFPVKLRDLIKVKFKSEEPLTLRLLALFILQEIGKMTISWAQSEKSCNTLFTSKEEPLL